MKPTHSPNKLEIILSFVVVFLASAMTGIVLPFVISTDTLPLYIIIALLLGIFLLFFLGIQATFNYFYMRSQRREGKCSPKKK